MTELKYVGSNRPYGMIVDVKEKDVEDLLKSGEWMSLITPPVEKEIMKEKKVEVTSGSDKHKSAKRY